jgi:hypothetical protein
VLAHPKTTGPLEKCLPPWRRMQRVHRRDEQDQIKVLHRGPGPRVWQISRDRALACASDQADQGLRREHRAPDDLPRIPFRRDENQGLRPINPIPTLQPMRIKHEPVEQTHSDSSQ